MGWFNRQPSVKSISPDEAKRHGDTDRAVFVDVRELDEWQAGHIQGARHLPLGQLKEHLIELLPEPEVIFVCRSGQRSAWATKALSDMGHSHAFNMTGGMLEWSEMGLPVKLDEATE